MRTSVDFCTRITRGQWAQLFSRRWIRPFDPRTFAHDDEPGCSQVVGGVRDYAFPTDGAIIARDVTRLVIGRACGVGVLRITIRRPEPEWVGTGSADFPAGVG